MTIDKVFQQLSSSPLMHSPFSTEYLNLEKQLLDFLKDCELSESGKGEMDFWEFGKIKIPYIEMGAISSLELFGLDELIIFLYYKLNQSTYKKVADIGCNIGLHSIILSKCGYVVSAYEPDENHIKLIYKHLEINNISNVQVNEAAVSDNNGKVEFTRVVGNTTGSHISGSKENPYGDLDRFNVDSVSLASIMKNVDFVKMDIEGHEAQAILSTVGEHWHSTDMMVEVGSVKNANLIFNHLSQLDLRMFSQKTGWKIVNSHEDMPTSYKEGSLFITSRDTMFWG
jgi:FkbM family methyltransferase